MNVNRVFGSLMRRRHSRCIGLQRHRPLALTGTIHTTTRLSSQFKVPIESRNEAELRKLTGQSVLSAQALPTDDSSDGVLRDDRGRPLPPKNPLDKAAVAKYEKARRKYHSRRANYAALAVVMLLAGPAVLMLQIGHPDNLSKEKDQQKRAREVTVRVQPRESSVSSSGWSGTERCDAPPSKDASTFLGKPVVVAPGGEKLIVKDESGMDIELVPTGTSSIPHFPKTIHLPHPTNNADTSEYTLLGLGIRSVSFLSIQVYVVGLYVRTASLPALQSTLVHRVNPTATALIPSEKADLRTALLDPDASYQLWDAVLADPAATKVDTALRVVPTRSTDFNHLRDGWVTGIKARTAAAQKAGDASFADESFAESMRGFQAALAGRGSAPKGSVIVLRRKEQGELEMLFQKREKVEGRGVGGEWEGLGTVEDERVARLLWLGYLGGKKVSSEGVRKAVVEGCMELVERPTGTLATRVE